VGVGLARTVLLCTPVCGGGRGRGQWLTVYARVWLCGADASTLSLVAETTNAHRGTVHSVGFSSDGTRIVSGSVDYSVKVWGGWSQHAWCLRVVQVPVA
jgi:WD40 repeat protein